jgi:hypothetical protein
MRESDTILRAHLIDKEPQILRQLFVRNPAAAIKKAKCQIKDPRGKKVLKHRGYQSDDECAQAADKSQLDSDNQQERQKSVEDP